MPIVRGKQIEVLFSAEEISKRNHAIVEDLSKSDLDNPLVIAILKGSFVFAADLVRAMHEQGMEPEMEFISISSYGSGTVAGKPKVLRDIESNVTDRNVILIDDILESGGTLKFCRDLMITRGARKVSTVVLLDKSMRRKANINADHMGFECPDKFVVGYGMDMGHAYRELPFVGEVV
ncbi:MAG: hypoxanthine phosphoribosyltransferase [Pseudomonadota bacterium]